MAPWQFATEDDNGSIWDLDIDDHGERSGGPGNTAPENILSEFSELSRDYFAEC